MENTSTFALELSRTQSDRACTNKCGASSQLKKSHREHSTSLKCKLSQLQALRMRLNLFPKRSGFKASTWLCSRLALKSGTLSMTHQRLQRIQIAPIRLSPQQTCPPKRTLSLSLDLKQWLSRNIFLSLPLLISFLRMNYAGLSNLRTNTEQRMLTAFKQGQKYPFKLITHSITFQINLLQILLCKSLSC